MSFRKWPLALKTGQSLVEVVIASAIAILVILALVSLTTIGIKNAQFARNQEQAVKLAQEGMEWVRSQRDQNSWSDFLGKNHPEKWCLNNLPSDWLNLSEHPSGSPATCPGTIGTFMRTVLVAGAGDTLNITVEVLWRDGVREHRSIQQSIFTNWQRK